jgi:hypothetical protein
MALQQHTYEFIFGMILAMALIIAATTWAFSPNPAAPIPPSEVTAPTLECVLRRESPDGLGSGLSRGHPPSLS